MQNGGKKRVVPNNKKTDAVQKNKQERYTLYFL